MKRLSAVIALVLSAVACLSAQNLEHQLLKHIEYLTSGELAGRKAGSEGERKAAQYLYDQLERAGVTMLTGREGSSFSIATPEGDTIHTCNVVGVLQGYDSELRDEYIVIGAHLDGLGQYELTVDGEPLESYFQGADANASGVAALIEVAKMASQGALFQRRSIIFAGFGASEREFAGSRYFALNGGFGSISSVKVMINLDMLGRGDSSNPFRIWSPVVPSTINSMMNYVKEHETVTTMPSLASGTIFPSDYLPFYQAGIASLTFSTGMSREYHTSHDVFSLIQSDNLAAATIYINAFLKSLASKDELFPQQAVAEKDADKVYSASDCDNRPQFFHNPEQFFLDNWVYKYLKYPHEAVSNGIQGKVIVSFVVEKNGAVTNVRIEKGVDELLDDEALRVVSVSPKWSAGEIGKKKVRTKIVIPVEFRLKKNR